MAEIEYGQTITESVNPDGSISITTKGYYDGLSTIKVQVREDIKTSPGTLLRDVVKCMDALQTDTPELNIRVLRDKYGNVNIIQKTWLVSKEKVK